MSKSWLVIALFANLTYCEGSNTPHSPGLPLHFGVNAGSFYTAGRWIPANSNDRAAYPSETEIDCYKKQQLCVEATADYYSGHPHILLNFYEILKWSPNGIVATSDNAICATGTIVVSFSDKSLTRTWTTKSMPADERQACVALGATGRDSEVFVVKNSKRWDDDPYGEFSNKF